MQKQLYHLYPATPEEQQFYGHVVSMTQEDLADLPESLFDLACLYLETTTNHAIMLWKEEKFIECVELVAEHLPHYISHKFLTTVNAMVDAVTAKREQEQQV